MKCCPMASTVVTRNRPVGLASRPATRLSNSTMEFAILVASPIISSPAAVGRYPERERSKSRAPIVVSSADSRRKTVE